jgi:hypothetical protein
MATFTEACQKVGGVVTAASDKTDRICDNRDPYKFCALSGQEYDPRSDNCTNIVTGTVTTACHDLGGHVAKNAQGQQSCNGVSAKFFCNNMLQTNYDFAKDSCVMPTPVVKK